MTAVAVIHRVTQLDLAVETFVWPFAVERRSEIDAYFASRQVAIPQLFNGRVLLGRNPVFSDGRLTASYFETDFASFLSWRDWGFPDKSVFDGFGMGALRTNDGAFVLGEMAGHTANAGRIYFAAGTPDLNDIVGDDIVGHTVDISGSVAREVLEETGLTAQDYRAADHWDCVVVNTSIALMRILDVDLPGETLRARIETSLAMQAEPELSAIHLARSVTDLTSNMPAYVTAFLEAQFG